MVSSKKMNEKIIEFTDPEADLKALATGNAELIKFKVAKINHAKCFTGEAKNALVIGATGFLGVHFIKTLISNHHYSTVYCFIRDKNGKNGLERIQENMIKYQCYDESNLDKIECIATSYTEKLFGLKENQYFDLAEKIDTVFHFSSSTDYEVGYNVFRDAYVLKNIDILNFCLTGKPKQIHYVCSTIAFIYQDLNDFLKPDLWWYSGYSKMKWVNRKLFLEAFKYGIQGAIYLPPYITGRKGLGIDPAYTYSYWRIILELLRIKVIWDGEFFQAIPVDILCKIILDNSLLSNPCNEIIPTLPTIHTREISNILKCKIVPWKEFKEIALSKFRKSERVLLKEMELKDIERLNLEVKGINKEVIKTFPKYADVLRSGLSQPQMKHWCELLKVKPQL